MRSLGPLRSGLAVIALAGLLASACDRTDAGPSAAPDAPIGPTPIQCIERSAPTDVELDTNLDRASGRLTVSFSDDSGRNVSLLIEYRRDASCISDPAWRRLVAHVTRADRNPPKPEPNTGPRPNRRQRPCSGPGVIRADIDGDGRADRVAHRWDRSLGHAILEVCTAAGGYDSADGMGQAEALHVFDIDGDGVEELAPDSNTAVLSFVEVVRFISGKLRRVSLASRRNVVLLDGFQNGGAEAAGCDDVDGDGDDELIQIRVVKRASDYRYRRDVFSVSGTSAVRTMTDRGDIEGHGSDFAVAHRLVEPCWDD
jgi:hypothetical protein